MILREYFPNRNVESSMEISDADSARYSSPFTETVHLPSRARRIFRSSNFIACDYSKNALSLWERAARENESREFWGQTPAIRCLSPEFSFGAPGEGLRT